MRAHEARTWNRAHERPLGFVRSGDRSFYLPISALENLIFFARLHGLRLRRARSRAREVLDAAGLCRGG
jgi:ABC-type multidrug transport system ATPase subunit